MNRRVSQIFIENAFKKQKIFIQGKNEKLDFTYIKDLANGSILAARKKRYKSNFQYNMWKGPNPL